MNKKIILKESELGVMKQAEREYSRLHRNDYDFLTNDYDDEIAFAYAEGYLEGLYDRHRTNLRMKHKSKNKPTKKKSKKKGKAKK